MSKSCSLPIGDHRKDDPQLRRVIGGYQSVKSKFSPIKPPSNPPNKGTGGKE